MAQLTYPSSMPTAVAGLFGEAGDKVVVSRRVASNQEIEAGLAVEWFGSADDEISVVSQALKPLGFAGRDPLDTNENTSDPVVYIEGDDVPVLTKGAIWVQTDGDVEPADDVFLRYRFFTQIISVVFDIDFVASNVINGTVGGLTIATVTFATSHTATFNALVTAVLATDLTRTVSSNPATRTMLITVDPNVVDPLDPLGDYVATTNFTVTLGASQAVDTVTESRAPSSSNVRGGVRADTDDTGAGVTAVALPQARFLTSASQGDLVLIDLNLP